MPVVCLLLLLLVFREQVPDMFLGGLPTPSSVFQTHHVTLCCAGFCRSFRRAAAVGEELHDDAVDQLLKVLGTGDVFYLVHQHAQSS